MPKTTKRTVTRRSARIAKAHATDLPKLEVKDPPIRRSPGYRPPTRGVARYPWAITIIVLLLALGIFALYANHVGPFALPKKSVTTAHHPTPAATASTHATPAATSSNTGATSPCLGASILKDITDTSAAPSASDVQKITHTYSQAPALDIKADKVYCAGINTNRGLMVVELDPKLAPNTVNNFVFLAQHHFYDGLTFHRVIPDTAQNAGNIHIAQTGDPLGNGTGGPGYKFADEPVQGSYAAGTLAMANSGANTNGSQFFINTTDNTQLPKSYNLFGHVVQGLDVAKKIQGPGDDAASKNIKPDVINHLIVVQAP